MPDTAAAHTADAAIAVLGGLRMKPPEELDKMADLVLNYRPKTKMKAAKKRAKKAAKKAKG